MNVAELVAAAMRNSGLDSTRKLAAELGVSHVAIFKWQAGEYCPSFEQCAELAELAGLPPVKTAAEARFSSPETKAKHGKTLRKIMQAAACLAVYLGMASLPSTAQANSFFSAHNSPTLYIMSN